MDARRLSSPPPPSPSSRASTPPRARGSPHEQLASAASGAEVAVTAETDSMDEDEDDAVSGWWAQPSHGEEMGDGTDTTAGHLSKGTCRSDVETDSDTDSTVRTDTDSDASESEQTALRGASPDVSDSTGQAGQRRDHSPPSPGACDTLQQLLRRRALLVTRVNTARGRLAELRTESSAKVDSLPTRNDRVVAAALQRTPRPVRTPRRTRSPPGSSRLGSTLAAGLEALAQGHQQSQQTSPPRAGKSAAQFTRPRLPRRTSPPLPVEHAGVVQPVNMLSSARVGGGSSSDSTLPVPAPTPISLLGRMKTAMQDSRAKQIHDPHQALIGRKLRLPAASADSQQAVRTAEICALRLVDGEEIWQVLISEGQSTAATRTTEEEYLFRPELDMLLQSQLSSLSRTVSLSDEKLRHERLHRLISSHWFDRAILVLIVLNCVVMVLQEEWPEGENVWNVAERVFLGCFVVEMALKMWALGLCRKDGKPPGYFRDAWNWLDFVIVGEGLLFLGVELSATISGEDGGDNEVDLSLLRIVRALRPLRAVTRLPELRVLVEALFQSIPLLGTTFLVFLFYFLVFGIAGLEWWRGLYRMRCFDTSNGTLIETDLLACGVRECPLGQSCRPWKNPNYGITSFDNILVSWLTIFQAITLEGWVSIMHIGQDTLGSAMCIYFIALLLVGSFIMLNLAMAIIVNKYNQGKMQAEQTQRQNQRRAHRRADARRKWRRSEKQERQNGKDVLRVSTLGSGMFARVALQAREEAAARRRAEMGKLAAEWKAVDVDGSGSLDREEVRAVLLKMGRHVTEAQLNDAVDDMDEDGSGHIDYDEFEEWWNNTMMESESDLHLRLAWPACCMKVRPLAAIVKFAEVISLKTDEDGFQDLRPSFDKAMCFCILANMVVLSIDHYDPESGTPVKLNQALDKVNLGFTLIFLTEMAIKILAMGIRRYVSSAMNLLDAFSAITGLMEKSMTSLRAIRFVRLLRLAKHLKSMQQIVAVLSKAYNSILYITCLLLLFIFIFTMAGMQLFSGKLIQEDGTVPRNNFDSFHWGLVSVFQVLQGENWPSLMHTGIRSVGWGVAVPFYVLWVAIGQLVILNLFLAVVMAYFDELKDMGNGKSPSPFRLAFERVCEEQKISSRGSERSITFALFGELFKEFTSSTCGSSNARFGVHKEAVRAHFTQWSRRVDAFKSVDMCAYPQGDSILPQSNLNRAAFDDVMLMLKGAGLDVDETVVQTAFHELKCGTSVDMAGFEALLGLLLANDNESLSAVALSPSVRDRFERLSLDGSKTLTIESIVRLLEEMGIQAEPELTTLVPESHEERAPVTGNVLLCIPAGSCLHLYCSQLVQWKCFDRFVLLLICLSSVALAVDHPTIDPGTADMLWILDFTFTSLFSLEVILKVVTYGLLCRQQAYLRSAWNVLDFVVVVASIVNLAASALDIASLRSFRLLRTLRPLRMVSRNQGMKIICNALVLSLQAILNVGVVPRHEYHDRNPELTENLTFEDLGRLNYYYAEQVLIFVWFMFALIGVQLFKGKLYHCSDASFPAGASRYGVLAMEANTSGINTIWATEPCTLKYGRKWERDELNFDSLPRALLSLYVFATGEGWPDAMFSAADAIAIDVQPARDASPLSAYFYVLYVAVTSFFFVELFVGAVFQRFLALKQEVALQGGAAFLTEQQQEWILAQKRLLSLQPMKPPSPPQLLCQCFGSGCTRVVNRFLQHTHRFVTCKCFEGFILGCILLNTVVMASGFHGEPVWWTDVLRSANLALTLVFVVEAAAKVIGLGIRGYFREPWNCLDFAIMAGSLVDIFGVEYMKTTMFRILRIARITRLARSLAGLRHIIETLWLSLPALFNVGTLLFLLLFVYATLGVALFGEAPRRQTLASDPTSNTTVLITGQGGLDMHSNFESWGNAMLVLIRTLTGEDWQVIMFDCSHSGVVNPTVVWVYFVSYVFFASFVVINLFVMIIADNFNQESKAPTEATPHGPNKVASVLAERFVQEWAKLDPYATRYIRREQVSCLLRALALGDAGADFRLLELIEPAPATENVSDKQLQQLERKLNLHYWRTYPAQATPSQDGDVRADQCDVEAGALAEKASLAASTAQENEWVHFSEILDKLHHVQFEDLHASLPARVLAKLPSAPGAMVRRLEAEMQRRTKRLSRRVSAIELSMHPAQASPRMHKYAMLARLSAGRLKLGQPKRAR